MLNLKGVVLAEIILSVIIICSISYLSYMFTIGIRKNINTLTKKEKALYVAKVRMLQVTSVGFENLANEVGCKSADSVIGVNGYLPGAQVCVNVANLSLFWGWGSPTLIGQQGDIKNVVVKIDW